MYKYLIILSILFLSSPVAKAGEESWFDSAWSSFGFGEEESAPAAPSTSKAQANSATTQESIEAVTKSLPTSMPKMADLTAMVTDQLGVSTQGATQAYSQFQSLGISTEQIPQYIDLTSEFLNSQGGKDASICSRKA